MPDGPGERRVRERHEELAPQRDQAAALGRELGLGPVVGLFVRETGGPGQTALGMLLIALILSVCVVPIGVDETGAAPLWVAWVIVAGVLVAIVPVARRFFRTGRRWWLYLYEGGLAALDHRGRVRESLRWPEVVRADWEWSPYDDGPGASLHGYRLRTHDGRQVRLPAEFVNAHDPDGAAGAVVRALTRQHDEAMPHFPTLAASLDAAVARPLARHAVERLAAGQTLAFGSVTVGPHGITYGKKVSLAWGEITGWKLDQGRLTIERAPGRPKRVTVPMTRTEDGWILVHLLTERR